MNASVHKLKAAGPATNHNWGLDRIVADLRDARTQWRRSQGRLSEVSWRELPSRETLRSSVIELCGALFPMRLGPPDLRKESEDFYVGHTLDAALNALLAQVKLELAHASPQRSQPTDFHLESKAVGIVQRFAASLGKLRIQLDLDLVAAYRGDPAAKSVDEVLLCYPGVIAMIHHRIAHRLYKLGLPLIARIVAEIAHSETGIDIHPGATIGNSFFIDHGTGVVIGETTIIGDRVRIYQAVTLGARRFPTDDSGDLQKGLARHPIVEDDVVIYAGATILGRVTIGQGSTIGGNVWITHSLPPGSNVSQARMQHEVFTDGSGI
ncbi:MAG: serine O-acetyltransferase [Burkholderiaceae bacterium]|nr:serine O-acetyltransferase [Burkholderiaceae bacterium]